MSEFYDHVSVNFGSNNTVRIERPKIKYFEMRGHSIELPTIRFEADDNTIISNPTAYTRFELPNPTDLLTIINDSVAETFQFDLILSSFPYISLETIQYQPNLISTGGGTVGTTQVQLSAATGAGYLNNRQNSYLIVKNTHATETIYIGANGVTTGTGFPVLAGESLTISVALDLYVIAGVAGVTYKTISANHGKSDQSIRPQYR